MESRKETAKGRAKAKAYTLVTPELHRLFTVACLAQGTSVRKRLVYLIKKDLEEMGIRSLADALNFKPE